MKNLLLIIFFIGIVSCSQDDCEVDPYVKKAFFQNLETINDIKDDGGINGESYISLFFLERLTGIGSKVNYGDVSYYENKKDIRDDIKKWKEWYSLNKCYLVKDSIVVVEKKVEENTSSWITKE